LAEIPPDVLKAGRLWPQARQKAKKNRRKVKKSKTRPSRFLPGFVPEFACVLSPAFRRRILHETEWLHLTAAA
jgi:hypothetical protein